VEVICYYTYLYEGDKLIFVIIRRNWTIIDQIVCISHIMENCGERIGTVYQLFIEFRIAYDSISRTVRHMVVIDFGILLK
jgi:hypothetical protein